MTTHPRRLALAFLSVLLVASTAPTGRPKLTFQDRVSAQEAIDRVYYAHQIGASKPFEQVVPRRFLESKVRDYMRKSAALARSGRPVTTAMLRAEVDRMAASTRLPERLRELSAALGDDPILIQECLARPVLVDRLTRELGALRPARAVRDGQLWGRKGAEVRGDRGPRTSGVRLPDSVAGHEASSAAAAVTSCQDDVWDNGQLGSPPPDLTQRSSTAAVWTGSHMMVVGQAFEGPPGDLYDPATDSWSPVSSVGAPPEFAIREGVSLVWTGTEAIYWGGRHHFESESFYSHGGRYNPLTDTWSPVSLSGPRVRAYHVALWTGSEMVVFGGLTSLRNVPPLYTSIIEGAAYDPETDTWRTAPIFPRLGAAAVWTGSEVLLWGGSCAWDDNLGGVSPCPSVDVPGGKIYDPATNSISQMSVQGEPPGTHRATAVWTGQEMIVWGGSIGSARTDRGGRYDPVTDQWGEVSLVDAPSARAEHSAVWTGIEMIVWGGQVGPNATDLTNTGGRYDPALDSWSATTLTDAPAARSDHEAVWTGSSMIVWTGAVLGSTNTGGQYLVLVPTDADGDGHLACTQDCDDADEAIHPGADEVCDGKDDDCDGAIPPDESDADGDGFMVCGADCDDTDPDSRPGGIDLPGDSADQDCDGVAICDPAAEWYNHGSLVQCVRQECQRLVDAGLVTQKTCGDLVARAGRGRVTTSSGKP